jgi:bifunctional non-homologous end joining protein LigD
MPDHVKPMLARLGEMPRGEGWGFEVKWDGVRTIAYWDGRRLRLESRNQNDVTASYPDLSDLGARLGDRRVILDGEIVAFDESGSPSFGLLQKRIHATPTRALTHEVPVTYVIFDLLYLEPRATMELAYEQRRELLEGLALAGPSWRTPSFPGVSGEDLLAVTAEHGLEGIVAKRLDSPYRPGQRGGDWLKIKNSRRQELVIGGWLPGRGRRSQGLGALLLGYHEAPPERTGLRYAGRVGSGFDEAELERLERELKARERDSSPFSDSGVQPPRESRFVEPELVADIRFGGWTKEAILRHSVYLGLREDMPAAEVIREDLPVAGTREPAPATARGEERRQNRRKSLPRVGGAAERVGEPPSGSAGDAARRPPDQASAAAPLYRVLKETKTHVEVDVEGRRLRLSNRDKILYPRTGFTKGDLIDYLGAVAPVLLPHLRGRQLTLKRYPDGVEGEFFYEKRCPAHRPEWVKTAPVTSSRQRSPIEYCLADTLPTLIWLGNLADLELHPSLHLASSQETPTMVVFDLDPGAPADLRQCCRVALWIKEIFEALSLETFAKTSGQKGMQIYLPLNSPVSYAQTKPFAKAVAELLEREHPRLVVSRMTRSARAGKVLIDWSQNDPNKTTVCVYSLRASERPMVSTPLTWEEVERGSRARREPNLSADPPALLERVDRFGDLFRALHERVQTLPDLAGSPVS